VLGDVGQQLGVVLDTELVGDRQQDRVAIAAIADCL
jgi:hypothetical protein